MNMASSVGTGRPYLRFDGSSAGLGRRSSGNLSSEFDQSLICGCGAYLGVLGGFRVNRGGQRSCYCPVCAHAIVMSRDGQILRYGPHDITRTPERDAS